MKKFQCQLLFILFFIANGLLAQVKYLKSYRADSLNTGVIQTIVGLDNSLILLGSANNGACMQKIDATTGNVLWCIRDKKDNGSSIFRIGSQDDQGNIYFTGLKGGKEFIAKFNSAGKLLKIKQRNNVYNFGWRIHFIDANNILLPMTISGNYSKGGIMCLDSNLNVKWAKYFVNSISPNYDMLIDDKHIFVLGLNGNETLITKLNHKGDFESAGLLVREGHIANNSYAAIHNGTICSAIFDKVGPGKGESMLAFFDTSLTKVFCKRYQTPQASTFICPFFSNGGELLVQGEMERPDSPGPERNTLASMNKDGSLNYFKATLINDTINYTSGPSQPIDKDDNYYFSYSSSIYKWIAELWKTVIIRQVITAKFNLKDPNPCMMDDIPVDVFDVPIKLLPLTIEVKDTLIELEPNTNLFDFQYVPVEVGTLCEEVSTIDQDSKNEIMNVFPNPATNHINVSTNTSSNKSYPATFTLYDLIGRQVLSIKMNYGDEDIDISGISEGLYLWNLSSKGQIYGQGKLVVER